MTKHKIYTMSFASVYPHYVKKVEKKGRTKTEVDDIICWLTGYSQEELDAQLTNQTDFETFFAEAPQLNPARSMIKGVVCGVRVEDIEEPTMQEIRCLPRSEEHTSELQSRFDLVCRLLLEKKKYIKP